MPFKIKINFQNKNAVLHLHLPVEFFRGKQDFSPLPDLFNF